MLLDRWLAVLDDDPPGTHASRLRGFERVLVVVLVGEHWARKLPHWATLDARALAVAMVVTVGGTLALLPRARRVGFATLAAAQATVVAGDFPQVGNHAYLELLLCALAAFLDPRHPDEARLLFRSARWMLFVVLFASGLQKLVHGYYFRGQFLAYALWIETFRPVLEPALPAAEFVRLVETSREVGGGPFLVTSTPFLALSNAVVLAEMLLAVGLLIRPTRLASIAGSAVLILAIEAAAREAFFGLLFLDMLLLFTDRDVHHLLLPPVAILLVGALLVRGGLLPEVVFY